MAGVAGVAAFFTIRRPLLVPATGQGGMASPLALQVVYAKHKPDAPVEKKKGWTPRNGPRSDGRLADVQRNAGCGEEMGLNAA
jgi:hypothetical protein